MDIKTLQVKKYRGCNVYIRNFHNIFEYLVVIKGELYTTHMVITKSPIQSLLGRPYTEEQLTNATKFLMNTAEATVDTVLDGASADKE